MSMLFAFYGTLMPSSSHFRAESLAPYGWSRGPCVIPGQMYAVEDYYPAVVPGEGEVHGELWEVRPEHYSEVLKALDQIEGYHPENPSASLYVRERIQLADPDAMAWVYLYNLPTDRLMPVRSGCWADRDLAHDAADDESVVQFWDRPAPDPERWWLIAAFFFWLAAMVGLIVGVIPTG